MVGGDHLVEMRVITPRYCLTKWICRCLWWAYDSTVEWRVVNYSYWGYKECFLVIHKMLEKIENFMRRWRVVAFDGIDGHITVICWGIRGAYDG